MYDRNHVKREIQVGINNMTSSKISPFDFIKTINGKTGTDIIEENEKEYTPFIVNRNFSFAIDTIFFANEMNKYNGILTNMQQFDFYYHALSKKTRYNKWVKAGKTDQEAIDLIKEYFGYSTRDAKELLSFLPDNDERKSYLNTLKKEVYYGGRKQQ